MGAHTRSSDRRPLPQHGRSAGGSHRSRADRPSDPVRVFDPARTCRRPGIAVAAPRAPAPGAATPTGPAGAGRHGDHRTGRSVGPFTAGYLALAVPAADGVMPSPQVRAVVVHRWQPARRAGAGRERPHEVPIERVPAHVRAAVLAAEDRTFYRDPGFDLGGLARAAWQGLRGGPANAGGITQQYLQQTRPGAGDTAWNRLTELVLAVKVSQQRARTRSWRLPQLRLLRPRQLRHPGRRQGVLRQGRRQPDGQRGRAAGRAGRSPTHTDPVRQPDRAVQRWNAVLDGMTDEGWLDRGARAAAQFPTTTPRPPTTDAVPADSTGHIVAAVAAELAELGISERDLAGGGLQVTTTLDPRRQRQALQAARGPGRAGGLPAQRDGGHRPGYRRRARLLRRRQRPRDGLRPRPAAGRLDVHPLRGAGPAARRPGARRAGGAGCGGRRGPRRGCRHAARRRPCRPGRRREISALDLASAYATFAADGVWRPPHLVASVSTADGRVLYQAAPRGEQRFAPQVARKVTATMLEVAGRTGWRCPADVRSRPAPAPSSRSPGGQPDDYWTAGFTPELATSVWVGPTGTLRPAPAPPGGSS